MKVNLSNPRDPLGLIAHEKLTARQQLRAVVAHPFVVLAGRPAGHIIVAETGNGEKVSVQAIEQVFNDMLIVDSLKGAGYFKRYALRNEELLMIAERLYGYTALQALPKWMREPNISEIVEWPRPSVVTI